MALTLTLREGEQFVIGDETFEVVSIKSDTRARVRSTATGREVDLSADRSQEIHPGARAFVGPRSQFHMTRIAIEAPRSIPVHRMQS